MRSVRKSRICRFTKGRCKIVSKCGRLAGVVESIALISSRNEVEYREAIGGYLPLIILHARPLSELASKA